MDVNQVEVVLAHRNQATSPNQPINLSGNLPNIEGEAYNSQIINSQVDDVHAADNYYGPAQFLEGAADCEYERRQGDAKVKEGIAFLKKFYNERASSFVDKRRNSNGSTNSMGFVAAND